MKWQNKIGDFERTDLVIFFVIFMLSFVAYTYIYSYFAAIYSCL